MICAVARAAKAEGEIVGRLGGEEFAILLDGTGLAGALEIAERLRRNVGALQFATGRGPPTVTCSLGLGEWQEGDSIDALLKRADVALYAAKTGGRNRVIAADAARPLPQAAVHSFVRGAARG